MVVTDMSSKTLMTKKILTKNISLFRCPICFSNVRFVDNSIICTNKHTFDISRKGLTTLYKTSKLKNNDLYSFDLFYNRRLFIQAGFYKELDELIVNIIKNRFINLIILDIGCGEGTFGYNIAKNIPNDVTIGIDLAKEGVLMATDYLPYRYLPILSDINNIPLNNNTCDVILDILSPISKNEVYRILKEDGIIIKVTPKKEYLFELRTLLNIKEYENEDTIDKNIYQNYTVLNKFEINEKKSLNFETFINLIKMTPLTKFKVNDDINYNSIDQITIALNIYVLKRKENK